MPLGHNGRLRVFYACFWIAAEGSSELGVSCFLHKRNTWHAFHGAERWSEASMLPDDVSYLCLRFVEDAYEHISEGSFHSSN